MGAVSKMKNRWNWVASKESVCMEENGGKKLLIKLISQSYLKIALYYQKSYKVIANIIMEEFSDQSIFPKNNKLRNKHNYKRSIKMKKRLM